MKRVLIFSLSYYPNFIGGAEVAIKEITDRIAPSDIEFHMVTLRYDSMLPRVSQEGNVLVHRIGFSKKNSSMTDLKKFPLHYNKMLFQFTAALKAFSLHRKHHYDAVWAVMAHSSGVPAAIFKIFEPRVPYILTLQEGDPPEYIESLMKPVWPLFSRAFTTADVVDAESNFLGMWARRRGFTGPMEVIPNGVDTERFKKAPPPGTREKVRASLHAAPGDMLLITTSRLVHKNAIDVVIRALPHLPAQVKFIVLGDGPDEQMLTALAQELAVTDRVSFLGKVAHAKLPDYLHSCDIFIRPSRSEGMGNSFIEAMAAGLPVIATQEGGITDFLFDAKRDSSVPPTGFAVERDNAEDIARAVERILADPDATRRTIENAHAFIAGRYEWDTIARDIRNKIFAEAFRAASNIAMNDLKSAGRN